jgi:hypothetical protein
VSFKPKYLFLNEAMALVDKRYPIPPSETWPLFQALRENLLTVEVRFEPRDQKSAEPLWDREAGFSSDEWVKVSDWNKLRRRAYHEDFKAGDVRENNVRLLRSEIDNLFPDSDTGPSLPASSPAIRGTYLSEAMQMMLAVVPHFAIQNPSDPANWPKKDVLVDYFKSLRWPDGSAVSPTKAGEMASLCRPAELGAGGQKSSRRQ